MNITVSRLEGGLSYYEGDTRRDMLRLLTENPTFVAFCMHHPTLLIQADNSLTPMEWERFLRPEIKTVSVIVGTPEDVGAYIWPSKQSA